MKSDTAKLSRIIIPCSFTNLVSGSPIEVVSILLIQERLTVISGINYLMKFQNIKSYEHVLQVCAKRIFGKVR